MKKIYFSSVLLYSLSHSLCAHSNSIHGNWYFGESAGATFPKVTNYHFVGTGPGWPDDLYTNHDVETVGLFSLIGGYAWTTNNQWLPFYSLGATYTYALPAEVSGTIFQYSLPQFENYNYQYKIQRQSFLGIIKADIYRYQNVMPFFSLGLGLSANRANHYREVAINQVTPRVSPGFQAKTDTHFSYTLGTGIDYVIKNNLWLGLEYNYGHFGYAQTGPGTSSYATEHLRTKLTASTVALSVYYFLDKTA